MSQSQFRRKLVASEESIAVVVLRRRERQQSWKMERRMRVHSGCSCEAGVEVDIFWKTLTARGGGGRVLIVVLVRACV